MTGRTGFSIRGNRRISLALLLASVSITLAVAFAADAFLWRLYRTAVEPSASAAPIDTRGAKDPLVVAIGRTSGGPTEWITYAHVFAHVQRDVGVPIVLRYVADPSQHAALLSDGETDLALISVRAYLNTREAARPQLVAVPYIKGSPSDTAVVVVKSGSEIHDLAGLKGRSIAVSNDLVSSPFVEWLVRREGHTTADYFGRVEKNRVMDVNLSRVAKGQVEATAVRRSALSTWPKGTFSVVAQSPRFGMPPLVARRWLDDRLVERVRESLLNAQRQGAIQAGSVIGGFTVPAESEYAFPAQMEVLDREMKREAEGEKP